MIYKTILSLWSQKIDSFLIDPESKQFEIIENDKFHPVYLGSKVHGGILWIYKTILSLWSRNMVFEETSMI